ncbi:MAG: 50S ribosomal protein L3 [Thermoprotei archaeon]|nr:MAG: 50S ribosomal protein L3 [Thermoprotei archaeon]
MAHRKTNAPRRGSLGFRPRKRASRLVPRVKSWPEVVLEKPQPLGFLAYKAGMTHVIMIDDRPNTPTYGKEIFAPVTILEAPPMVPLAIRVYRLVPGYGYLTLGDLWVEAPKELEIWRKIPTYSPTKNREAREKWLRDNIDKIARVSIVAASQPKLVGGLSKKKPDLLEIAIGGGSIEEQLDYALKILGRVIRVEDVFREGQLVDVIGVTKGKGFQGVVKRFGVKELPRWHKHRKGSRRVGSRSPTIGAVSEVPQAGQMGFHRRTEYNKRILKIGHNGFEITPAGGFPHYGVVRSTWIMLQGTVMGPPKRPIVLRWAIRPSLNVPQQPPKIVYVSLESKVAG